MRRTSATYQLNGQPNASVKTLLATCYAKRKNPF